MILPFIRCALFDTPYRSQNENPTTMSGHAHIPTCTQVYFVTLLVEATPHHVDAGPRLLAATSTLRVVVIRLANHAPANQGESNVRKRVCTSVSFH